MRHAPDWLNSKRRTDQRLDQHCARDSVANQLCMNLYNSLYRWYSLTLPRFQQKTWSGEIMFSIITLKRVIWAPREKKIALPSQKNGTFSRRHCLSINTFSRGSVEAPCETPKINTQEDLLGPLYTLKFTCFNYILAPWSRPLGFGLVLFEILIIFESFSIWFPKKKPSNDARNRIRIFYNILPPSLINHGIDTIFFLRRKGEWC